VDAGLQDALQDVKVVDLSRLLPGPMCSWYLRGLGARVIKVEDPAGGDWLRHLPPLLEDGTSAWFSAINAGARSVSADLKAPADRALVEALIAEADVLIEGFRPGVLQRLGLDPLVLRARHPGLVVASITGFGQTGPLRDASTWEWPWKAMDPSPPAPGVRSGC
jgi:crotonobetainyl-CoA:carnitine CoA-transferase CaiB-like acyl-CoA transferase